MSLPNVTPPRPSAPEVDPLVAAALAHGRRSAAPRHTPRHGAPPAYWASASAHGLSRVAPPTFSGDGYGASSSPNRGALILDAQSGDVVTTLGGSVEALSEAQAAVNAMGFSFGDGADAATVPSSKRDLQLRSLLAFFGFWLLMSALFLFFYLDRFV